MLPPERPYYVNAGVKHITQRGDGGDRAVLRQSNDNALQCVSFCGVSAKEKREWNGTVWKSRVSPRLADCMAIRQIFA